MARIARAVAPGVPHRVTQRGVRRMDVFFCDPDRLMYLDVLRQFGAEHGLAVWGYCLMTEHVHLMAVPGRPESLAEAVGRTHWHYTRGMNFREEWRGVSVAGAIRGHARTGRLLGAAGFVDRIGHLLGRSLQPEKRGPKKGSHWRWSKKAE